MTNVGKTNWYDVWFGFGYRYEQKEPVFRKPACRKEGAAQKGCEITSKLRLQVNFYLFNVFWQEGHIKMFEGGKERTLDSVITI